MSSFKIVLIVGILFAVQSANARPSVVAEEKSPAGYTPGGFPHEERKFEATEAKSPGPSHQQWRHPPPGVNFPHEERKIEAEAKSPGAFTPGGFLHEAEGRHEAVEVNAPVVQGRSGKPIYIAPGGFPPGHPHERSETPGHGFGYIAPGGVPLVPGHPHERSETPEYIDPSGLNGHENPGRTLEKTPLQVKAPCDNSEDDYKNCGD